MPVEHPVRNACLGHGANRLARLEGVVKQIGRNLVFGEGVFRRLASGRACGFLRCGDHIRSQPPLPHHARERLLRQLGQPIALLVKVEQLAIALLCVERA